MVLGQCGALAVHHSVLTLREREAAATWSICRRIARANGHRRTATQLTVAAVTRIMAAIVMACHLRHTGDC